MVENLKLDLATLHDEDVLSWISDRVNGLVWSEGKLSLSLRIGRKFDQIPGFEKVI